MRVNYQFLALFLVFVFLGDGAFSQSSQTETIRASANQEVSRSSLHHRYLQEAVKANSPQLGAGNLELQKGPAPTPSYQPKSLRYQGSEKIQCSDSQRQLCGPGGSSGGAFLAFERANSVLKLLKEFIANTKVSGDWGPFLELQVVPQEEIKIPNQDLSSHLNHQLRLSLSSDLQKAWSMYDWLIFLLANSIQQKYITFEQGMALLNGLSQQNPKFEFAIFDNAELARNENETLPGCYDRAKIRTNYRTGRIYIELSSTGKCWPEELRVISNIPQEAFMNRPLQFQCESLDRCRLMVNQYDEQLAFCFSGEKNQRDKVNNPFLWIAPNLSQVALKIPLCLPKPTLPDERSWDTQQLYLEFKYHFVDGKNQ